MAILPNIQNNVKMQNKAALSPFAMLFRGVMSTAKPAAKAIGRGAAKTVSRAAGVKPEEFAAAVHKKLFKANHDLSALG